MILVRVGLRTSQLNIQGGKVCGVEIHFGIRSILLLLSYIRYGTGEGAEMLCRALKKSQEKTPLSLVGMDSNGQSPLWGPEEVELEKVGELIGDVLGEGRSICDKPSRLPTHLCWG